MPRRRIIGGEVFVISTQCSVSTGVHQFEEHRVAIPAFLHTGGVPCAVVGRSFRNANRGITVTAAALSIKSQSHLRRLRPLATAR